jgi:hypothetical protein
MSRCYTLVVVPGDANAPKKPARSLRNSFTLTCTTMMSLPGATTSILCTAQRTSLT